VYPDTRSGNRIRTRSLCLGLAASCAAALAIPAAASAASASSGGVRAPAKPKVDDVVCISRCVSGHQATPGSIVKVKGAFLDRVTRVVFRGEDGPLRSRYKSRGLELAKAVVPKGAIASRPYVIDSRGNVSNRSRHKLEILPPSAIPEEVFPVRGWHTFGGSGSRFGAPRSGHTHQGQDIGAACGTRLVSIRKARVRTLAYEGAAGNYVVLHNVNTHTDFVYMHLIKPAAVSPGQVISAGQKVGYVGQTGDATGCHLHFEFWRGIWYGGGHPVDPLHFLKVLDAES
jgi:murein DD-endopeptidase MepM/ murein hydrolase activator NlpD